jgi:stage V sporulation protein SpoVS
MSEEKQAIGGAGAVNAALKRIDKQQRLVDQLLLRRTFYR